MKKEPLLVILSGNSGSGKTTTMKNIVENSKGSNAEKVFGNEVISTTTRKARDGEVDGRDYHFIKKEDFEWDEMAEKAEYLGNYYGVTKEELDKKIKLPGGTIVCEIEGMRQYIKIFHNTLSIFLVTSKNEIERRLTARGGDKSLIKSRLENYPKEVDGKNEYDVIIEVDGKTVEEVSSLVLSEVEKRISL